MSDFLKNTTWKYLKKLLFNYSNEICLMLYVALDAK